jgi:cysteine synthase
MNAAARQGDCLLDVVGSTPVVRLQRVRPEGGAEIWLKLEHLEPSGSVEDRVGAALLDAGPIRASPDRAIAVALAARVRGATCEVSLTAPPTHEQREMLRLLGAEIIRGGVAAMDGPGRAERQTDGAAATTHSRRAERTKSQADAAVDGTPLAEPSARATAAFRESLGAEVAAWVKDLEPPLRLALIVAPPALAAALDRTGVPVLAAAEVPAAEATAMASRLAREEGLLVGPATGAGVLAAFRAAAARAPSEAVLAFALESGERYFSAAMESLG